MKINKIAVIGGGASGIYTTILLARRGIDVTLFERNQRIGKKILTTGNGRCNLTNKQLSGEDYNHPDFVNHVLSRYSVEDTLSFFKSLGIEVIEEENGKYFPLSLQASSIVNAFLQELDMLHVSVLTNTYISQVQKNYEHFILTDQINQKYSFDFLIISSGGKAFPSTGSDGVGYDFAKTFGHHLSTIRPSLVKLTVESPYLKHLDGVKLNTTVELIVGNDVSRSEKGDVLFTNYGLSGPTILQLSKYALLALEEKKDVYMNIKFITSMSKEDLINRFYMLSYKKLEDWFNGIIPSRLIVPIIKEAKLSLHQEVSSLSYEEMDKLVSYLMNFKFKVTGSKDFDEAQVTSGGIELQEVHPDTLESLLCLGLYFTGEILDVDGRSGGYNLQWAWSSAGLVAKAIGDKK